MTTTAIVLCGGASRRFGSDKLAATYAGRPLLDVLLDSLPEEWAVICVGPTRDVVRDVAWASEEPPGGGPLAGIAAALAYADTDVVVVIAGDMPKAGPAAEALANALRLDPSNPAVVAVDADGRANPLLAAYRTSELRLAIPERPSGVAARRLLDVLSHRTLLVVAPQSLDVDHPDDLPRLDT